MKSIYCSFFHNYLTYGNIAWCSTSITKLKKIFSKQEQAIISMTSLDYKKLKLGEIIEKLGILNIDKLNIYHTVNPMFRKENNTVPEAFRKNFN